MSNRSTLVSAVAVVLLYTAGTLAASDGQAVFLDIDELQTSEIIAVSDRATASSIRIASQRIESLVNQGRTSRAQLLTERLQSYLGELLLYRGAGVDLLEPPTEVTLALVASFAADGSMIDRIIIGLVPDGDILKSPDKFVVVADDLFDADGPGNKDSTGFTFGDVPGITFIAGEVGGYLIIFAPGLDPEAADVIE